MPPDRDIPVIRNDAERLEALLLMAELSGAIVGTPEERQLRAVCDAIELYDRLKRAASAANDNDDKVNVTGR